MRESNVINVSNCFWTGPKEARKSSGPVDCGPPTKMAEQNDAGPSSRAGSSTSPSSIHKAKVEVAQSSTTKLEQDSLGTKLTTQKQKQKSRKRKESKKGKESKRSTRETKKSTRETKKEKRPKVKKQRDETTNQARSSKHTS